jgi:exodeoxyribonuclease VII small subunit
MDASPPQAPAQKPTRALNETRIRIVIVPTDPAKLSYEEARNELVAVVADLEAGTATLEETIELWERGEALAARCEEWLVGAKERLNKAKAASTETED